MQNCLVDVVSKENQQGKLVFTTRVLTKVADDQQKRLFSYAKSQQIYCSHIL